MMHLINMLIYRFFSAERLGFGILFPNEHFMLLLSLLNRRKNSILGIFVHNNMVFMYKCT